MDNDTQLPELPEGYFWEITEETRYEHVYVPARPTGFLVLLLRKSFTVKHTTVTGKLWWKKTIVSNVPAGRIEHSEQINFVGGNDSSLFPSTDPADVLLAAERIMKRRETDARRAKLIGTYPPKTL